MVRTRRPLRRAVPRVAAVLAVLAGLSAVGACDDGGEDTPRDDATTAAPAEPTPSADAAAVPLEGLPSSPLRWRESELNEDPAVLAARRFVALRRTIAASPEPNTLKPLYAAVTADDLLEVVGEPFPNPSPPPEGLDQGPVYLWVMGSEETSGAVRTVDLCLDTGWSDRGTAPTQRQQAAFPLRVVVQRDSSGPDSWKVTTVQDPAAEFVGPDAVRECEAWGATHTSPDSPA